MEFSIRYKKNELIYKPAFDIPVLKISLFDSNFWKFKDDNPCQ